MNLPIKLRTTEKQTSLCMVIIVFFSSVEFFRLCLLSMCSGSLLMYMRNNSKGLLLFILEFVTALWFWFFKKEHALTTEKKCFFFVAFWNTVFTNWSNHVLIRPNKVSKQYSYINYWSVYNNCSVYICKWLLSSSHFHFSDKLPSCFLTCNGCDLKFIQTLLNVPQKNGSMWCTYCFGFL